MGFQTQVAPEPLAVAETGGSEGMGAGREGDHPGCTSEARKLGETRPGGGCKPRTLALARGRAPSTIKQKKGRMGGSEAETIRQARDQLRAQPQEGSLIAGAGSSLLGGYALSAVRARPALLRGPGVSLNDQLLTFRSFVVSVIGA
jgi:hypothetical protein